MDRSLLSLLYPITFRLYKKQLYWLLDKMILLNPSTKPDFEQNIKNLFSKNDSPHMVWDAFKAVLRGQFISKSSYF